MRNRGLLADALSIQGEKRQQNQDRFLLNTGHFGNIPVGLFVVADGMGGLSEGARASQTLIYGLDQWWQNDLEAMLIEYNSDVTVFKNSLDNCLRTINQNIVRYGEESHIQMGTTLVGMFVWGNECLFLNIGDSRAYHITNGNIIQITQDHSWVNEQILKGHLKPEDAQTHQKRNLITRCIGISIEIEVDYYYQQIYPEDIFVLCSDGFYSCCQEACIQKNLFGNVESQTKLTKAVQKLSEMILATTHADDATAAVVVF